MDKIEKMVQLQLVANVQHGKTGEVEPKTMAEIEELAEDFNILDHMLVMVELHRHFDNVAIQVVK